MWTHLSLNGIVLLKEQMDALQRYHDELVYWNERINMVSRKDVDHLWERHIIHSLLLLKYVQFPERARVLDVGTGGGLPGVPLKIARPDIKLTMVDSIRKKARLAEMFGQHTGLKDIAAHACRVEDLATNAKYRGTFDVIVSRAVAPVAQLLEWTYGLLRKHGLYAFLKGGNLDEELAEARMAFPQVQIQETLIQAVGLPQFEADEKKVITCRYS